MNAIFIQMISLDEFIAAASKCETEKDAFALVMRGDENGTAEVRERLRPETCAQADSFRRELRARRWGVAIKWIGSAMRLLQFESDFSAPGANTQMPKVLVEENSALLLSEAEKRGLDVRLWDRTALLHSLLYPRAMVWLHKRVNLEARILPVEESCYSPVFDLFGTYEDRVGCLRAVLELRCYALVNVFGPEILPWKETGFWAIFRLIEKKQIDRFLCLEGGGMVLAILFRHAPPARITEYRRKLRKCLAVHAKITASDFASAGLKMPAGPN